MKMELLNHGEWITEFGFFLLLAINIVTLVKMFRPQRREVSLAEAHATKEETRLLSGRLEKLEEKFYAAQREFKADRDALLTGLEERVARIHERINEVLAAVSELKGKVNGRVRR